MYSVLAQFNCSCLVSNYMSPCTYMDNFPFCVLQLDDKPVQHREVMDHESELFKGYFKTIELLEGGLVLVLVSVLFYVCVGLK